MFAVCAVDREARVLTLARDRMGEKPLYYGWQGDVFLFGSEPKALRSHPAFRASVDRTVQAMYMRRGYVPAPFSIYGGSSKLMPGTFIQLPASGGPQACAESRETTGPLHDVAAAGLAQPFEGSDEDAITALETSLGRAVLQQTIADVPLGAFLSGGVDSSTVAALLQKQSSRPIKTFTIGFHEAEFQEAQHAREVAKHLGTDHTEWYVTPKDALDVIPLLPSMYDEPFGDSSAVPTHLVAKFARTRVTVRLSGDGGDELFGGYTRYRSTDETWRQLSRIPVLARGAISLACEAFADARRSHDRDGGRAGWSCISRRGTRTNAYAARILQYADAHRLVLGSGSSASFA